MQRLWAPWRIEYIKSEPRSNTCIFCSKPTENNDQKNFIVHRGASCFIILNFYPYNNGHLMVVPYRHLSEFGQLNPAERIEIMNLLDQSLQILKTDMAPHGFNIGVNLGKVAGAGIADHLHFHIVPRWNGDHNFMPVCGHTKVISEGIAETCERLRLKFDAAAKLA
ncbi:HIT domain-containing protein [candidate division KSB1 bacterium]|nr:HIT domain-containing protein [candidate division KSB1 bacterium]